MRIELWLFFLAGLAIWYIYTDGKYIQLILHHKKYYQIAGVVLATLFLYWIVKKTPQYAKGLLFATNDYIKYLPVDRKIKPFIEPLIDFTAKQSFQGDDYKQPIISLTPAPIQQEQQRTATSDRHKRSVSESKKKYVASQQDWKCKECQNVLPATYEVDHIVRLQHGGSNELDNLQALCPSCHRNKTMVENFSI